MGSKISQPSEEEVELQNQQKRATELLRNINIIKGAYLTNLETGNKQIQALQENYRKNIVSARRKQTELACQRATRFVLDLQDRVQTDDGTKDTIIKFNGINDLGVVGQINSISNSNNPDYQLSNQLLMINQMKDNALTELRLFTDGTIEGINNITATDYNGEAFDNINCDQDKKCTCILTLTGEEVTVLPSLSTPIRSSLKRG